MWNLTLDETLLAKKAYEEVLKQAERTAKHYHTNNGCFSDSCFHQDINEKGQSISFCDVRAHHQNGFIENKNKKLTLGARSLLLHGMCHWPQMVDTMFWPFAIKGMAEWMNSLHIDPDSNTPELLMYGLELDLIPIKNFHTTFCPICVLDHWLQSAGGPSPPKWKLCSRMGVYLGHLPFHAGSVALVFNPKLTQCLNNNTLFLTIIFQLFCTWNKERFLWTGRITVGSLPNQLLASLWTWHWNGYQGINLMSMRMDTLFLFRIGFLTLSVLCLISMRPTQNNYAQIF